MIINENGMVRFCCFQNYPIANLNKFNNIDEIWNSGRAQNVRYLLSLNKTPSLCLGAACKYMARNRDKEKASGFAYEAGKGSEVSASGLYDVESDLGIAFRWTDGNALVEAPWPHSRSPMLFQLFFFSSDFYQGDQEVEITIEGETVVRRMVPVGHWAEDIILSPGLLKSLENRSRVRVGIRGSTFTPSEIDKELADSRKLGLGLCMIKVE
jgi:hypothetical protein